MNKICLNQALHGLSAYLTQLNSCTRFISELSKAILLWFIILSYAFKMRQDYLSTSYLDQKYLPSERSETREI